MEGLVLQGDQGVHEDRTDLIFLAFVVTANDAQDEVAV